MKTKLKKKVKKVKEEKTTKKIKSKVKKSKTIKITNDNWEGRNLYMRCKTCMSYMKKKDLDSEKISIGRCRKRAPTMDGFPVVYATDWCGSHKIDEDKI